jgi:predicted enzyme involved in methoxymalonyl-ACP biosynthesis
MATFERIFAMTEPVRLVIWDLDETFWHGTLTEGGISSYSMDNHISSSNWHVVEL